MNEIIATEIDFQQKRFYERLKKSGSLVVELWPGAKNFLNSIPGIEWKQQGNKILITEKKVSKMKTFRDVISEGKAKYFSKFGGYSRGDNILDGITVEDLETMIMSNTPKDQIDPKSIKKAFDELMKTQMDDAKNILKKVTADMVKSLKQSDDID
jgi:hypothetical protein